MKPENFFEKFSQFADAPDAVAKMRELVLDLAIQGKLVVPEASDGDGHSLLARLRTLPPERNSKSRSPQDIPVEPETPFEIPSHWALTTVENATRETGFFCDGDWVESKDQDPDGDVRLIQLADVGDGEYRNRSSRFMTNTAAKRLNCSYLQAGDILVARMPDPLGRCCRFPGDSKPAVTVVDVCILRPNVGFFDPDFLVIAINCPRFRRLVSAQATGTTRSRISRSNLSVLPIPLPPLAEQKRIVTKVHELLALCDRLAVQQKERETRHAALARASLARFADAPTPANLRFLFHPSCDIAPADLRRSILTLAIQGRLVPQDANAEPAVSMSYEPADGSSYDVPPNWRWVRLGELAQFINGDRSKNYPSKSYRVTDGVPFINAGHLSNGDVSLDDMDYITEEHFARLGGGKVERGDVLYCIRGSLGKCAVVSSIARGAIASSLVIIRPRETILARYLHAYLVSPLGELMTAAYDSGSAQPNLSAANVKKYVLPLPPLAEQRRIVAKVGQLMGLADNLEAQLAAAKKAAAYLVGAAVAELTAEA